MIKFLVDGLERCEICLIPLERGYEFIERKHLVCIWLMSQQYIILPDVMSEGLRLTPLSNFISIDEIDENSKYRLKRVAERTFGVVDNENLYPNVVIENEANISMLNSDHLGNLLKTRRRAEAQNIKFFETVKKWINEGRPAPSNSYRVKTIYKFFKFKNKRKPLNPNKYTDTDSIFMKQVKKEKGEMFKRDKPRRQKQIKRADLYSKLLNIHPIIDVDKEIKKDEILYRRK